MALTDRASIRTELLDQGFDYLSATRVNNFIDEACAELNNEGSWPWRVMDTTGPPPLAIPHGLTIEQVIVVDAVNAPIPGRAPLFAEDRERLRDAGHDLTQTGPAQFWYLDLPGAGATTLRTHPVENGVRLQVRGWSQNAWTIGGQTANNDTDTPLIPVQFRDLVLLLAKMRAQEDNDQYSESQQVYARYQQRLEQAKSTFLLPQVDEHQIIRHVGDWA